MCTIAGYMRGRVWIVVLVVLALRLPFLNQAVQGDDYNYLHGAMHAQIDPLHPTHGQYVFLGRMVDMRGHPHPPLNMWVLAALLALAGDVKEVPFHAAYMVFSLIAALAMWSLAGRFARERLWATLLFLAAPAFVVNGNSFESDVPFLAFWMASVALWVVAVDRGSAAWLAAAGAAMAVAALSAYQAVVLIPILGFYLWQHRRGWKAGWVVLVAPVAVLGGWQLFERLTGGALPAGVLAGYFESYGFQALGSKAASAVALTVHAGWLVFPALVWVAFRKLPVWAWIVITLAMVIGAALLDPHPLFWMTFGTGLALVAGCFLALAKRMEDPFLIVWALMFFAAALALFFAGSARYLLPMAAPVAILVANRLEGKRKLLAAGLGLQVALSLSLAVMNYHHWDGYRRFVEDLEGEFPVRRVWVNGGMGLQFYAESAGALPLEISQAVRPGEMVLTSEAAYPVTFTTGGGLLTSVAETEIDSVVPLGVFGLNVRSAYSTVTLGYRAFDLRTGPLDRVRAELVVEHEPKLEWLPMGAPEADSQIVSGIYQLEDGRWRWMGSRAVVLLKPPAEPKKLAVELYIPDPALAKRVTLELDGAVVAEVEYDKPGSYTLASENPVTGSRVAITVDQTFSPPGDHRELGIILAGAGFR